MLFQSPFNRVFALLWCCCFRCTTSRGSNLTWLGRLVATFTAGGVLEGALKLTQRVRADPRCQRFGCICGLKMKSGEGLGSLRRVGRSPAAKHAFWPADEISALLINLRTYMYSRHPSSPQSTLNQGWIFRFFRN